jgi:hypothetical protein
MVAGIINEFDMPFVDISRHKWCAGKRANARKPKQLKANGPDGSFREGMARGMGGMNLCVRFQPRVGGAVHSEPKLRVPKKAGPRKGRSVGR